MRSQHGFWRTIAITSLLLVFAGPRSAMAAIYYASPAGGGDGRARTAPFLVSDFWAVAHSGDTLILLDGTYRDVALSQLETAIEGAEKRI